jgi:Holliday junction resolvase RusA-like endonuclease
VIRFFVPHLPIAQPRQRSAVRSFGGGKVRAVNYTPAAHPVNVYKLAVIQAAREATTKPLEGPLRVQVVFYMPHSKLSQKQNRIWHSTRPDVDNLLKSTFDALKGIAWGDDTQVCELASEKRYAVHDVGVSVAISQLDCRLAD